MDEKQGIKEELRAKTVGYVATALGLVVGLAWNDAIKELITFLFPLSTNNVLAKFGYAILLTVIVVVVIHILNRFSEKKEA